MKKVVPGKPYVYLFEYKATYEPEEVMVIAVIHPNETRIGDTQMSIIKH